MMPQTLSLFLVVLWLSISGSFQAEPELIFSSNVTSAEIGKSIKLTCQLENFDPGTEHYGVAFYRDKDHFCFYFISAPDSSGHRGTTYVNQTGLQPSLGHHPLSSTFPVYEITVTPTLASTMVYWCSVYTGTRNVNSKHLSLTVTPPPPSALLSSNMTSPLLAHPFTLSCTFARFNPIPVEYSVQFSSSRDGQLAVYEVSKEKTLLVKGFNHKVAVSQGQRSTFPNFDLVITEKMDNSSAYWCTLNEEDKAPVKSNTWPTLSNLTVQFTGSKPADNQLSATCSVVGPAGLEPSSKTYSVQFWSDFGPKKMNLLAEYSFKPNLREEFTMAQGTSWGTIYHGASTSWSSFSILANDTGSLHGTWWCVLAVGEQGTPGYREIKSNIAIL